MKFVIYGYPWDETVGGNIVLHALCARLNDLGHQAWVWPWWKPACFPRDRRSIRPWLSYLLRGRFSWTFDAGPLSNPVASTDDLDNAVVIYPEIVEGNPLSAERVVRWLLYPPGQHTGRIDFRPGELIVAYNAAFVRDFLPDTEPHLLRVTYQIPAYRQWNFGVREGACVLVRKGADRPLNQHPADAIPVDELSHEERAAVFNRVRYCYSYDPYTYYSVYGALCGCIPVVVPVPGLTEEQWQPDPLDRLGLAYGVDRIGWAEESREELRKRIWERAKAENESVRDFVELVRSRGW